MQLRHVKLLNLIYLSNSSDLSFFCPLSTWSHYNCSITYIGPAFMWKDRLLSFFTNIPIILSFARVIPCALHFIAISSPVFDIRLTVIRNQLRVHTLFQHFTLCIFCSSQSETNNLLPPLICIQYEIRT